MQTSDLLKSYLAKIDVELDDAKIASLLSYSEKVLVANEKFNLTSITDINDFLIKHIADSLVGISEIGQNSTLCDIGAGAGFPSVPIAIARRDVRVTALDSTEKKMTFVGESAKSIGLDNLKTVIGRAEEKKELLGKFDVVTARAVSALPVLLELAIPLLKVGGKFLAYKTDESELPFAKSALKTLGAKHAGTKFATLPNGDKRAILIFEKVGETPDRYPRRYGLIKSKPL